MKLLGWKTVSVYFTHPATLHMFCAGGKRTGYEERPAYIRGVATFQLDNGDKRVENRTLTVTHLRGEQEARTIGQMA